MNNKICISIIFFLIVVFRINAITPETVGNKKLTSFINSVYKNDGYKLMPLFAKDSLTDKAFFGIEINDTIAGILCLSSARGRFDFFDYGLICSNELEIKKVVLFKYRSNYGYQIANKRWLKQFTGLKPEQRFNYGKEIDVISGATLSGPAFVNDIKMTLAYLKSANQQIEK